MLIQTRSTSPSKADACVPIKTESRASRNVCLSGGRMRATSRLVANVLRRWRLRLVFWVSARHNRHRPPPAHGHRNPVGRPDRRAPGPAARGGNYCRYPLCARLRRQITNVPSDSAASNGGPSRTPHLPIHWPHPELPLAQRLHQFDPAVYPDHPHHPRPSIITYPCRHSRTRNGWTDADSPRLTTARSPNGHARPSIATGPRIVARLSTGLSTDADRARP